MSSKLGLLQPSSFLMTQNYLHKNLKTSVLHYMEDLQPSISNSTLNPSPKDAAELIHTDKS